MRFLLSLLLGVAGVVSQGANEADDLLSQLSRLHLDKKQIYHVRDITMDGTGSVIQIAPWTQYFDLQGQPPPTSR